MVAAAVAVAASGRRRSASVRRARSWSRRRARLRPCGVLPCQGAPRHVHPRRRTRRQRHLRNHGLLPRHRRLEDGRCPDPPLAQRCRPCQGVVTRVASIHRAWVRRPSPSRVCRGWGRAARYRTCTSARFCECATSKAVFCCAVLEAGRQCSSPQACLPSQAPAWPL